MSTYEESHPVGEEWVDPVFGPVRRVSKPTPWQLPRGNWLMKEEDRDGPAPARPAETVRKIAELALNDAIEITVLIALMRGQNSPGVKKQIDAAGAGTAFKVLQHAFLARLVTLIARAHPEPKNGDLHLHVATRLLKDKVTREIFAGGGGAEKLAAFEAHWVKCRGDHRLQAIKDFRDKHTAHLGEPKDIQEATYRDLFEVGADMAKAMELLALATNVAVKSLDTDPDLSSSPAEFWARWESAPVPQTQ